MRPSIHFSIATAVAMFGCSSSGSGPSGPSNRSAIYVAALTPTVSQGDTAIFALSFSSKSVIGQPLIFHLSVNGGPAAADTTQVPTPPDSSLQFGIGLVLPAALPDGTLTFTAVLPEDGDSSSATITVKDTRPPKFQAFVFPGIFPTFSPVVASGPLELIAGASAADTMEFQVIDNHTNAWAGWALGPPANLRDSVAISDTIANPHLAIAVPSSLVGTASTLTAFARDADGNTSTMPLGSAVVVQYVHHPIATAALDTTPDDMVYDVKRNVVYMLEHQRTGIAVFSLASMSYQPPIVLPVPPVDLDITPGGDTLIATLSNSADVAVVGLAGPTYTVSTMHLQALDAMPGDTTNLLGFVAAVRVMANDRALIGVAQPGGGSGLLLDLTHMTASTVTLPYIGGFFGRSGDRTKVMSEGLALSIYEASSGAITTIPVPGSLQYYAPVSASTTGTSIAVGLDLFNSTSYVGPLRLPLLSYYWPPATTLTNAGTNLYAGAYSICGITDVTSDFCPATTSGMLLKARMLSATDQATGFAGQLVEVSDAPQTIEQVLMLPGDTQLLGIGPTKVMLIDLSQATPVASVRTGTPQRSPRPIHQMHSSPLTVRLRFRGHERILTLGLGPRS